MLFTPFHGGCNLRRLISIVMVRFLVTLGTWQCLWHSRVTLACGDRCRADCIAQWCLSCASCKRAGLGLVGLCAPSFFATHHLSHTTLSHTTLHIQLVLLLDPPPPPLSFLPSPSPLQHMLLNIGRSWLVGLSGPLIWRRGNELTTELALCISINHGPCMAKAQIWGWLLEVSRVYLRNTKVGVNSVKTYEAWVGSLVHGSGCWSPLECWCEVPFVRHVQPPSQFQLCWGVFGEGRNNQLWAGSLPNRCRR